MSWVGDNSERRWNPFRALRSAAERGYRTDERRCSSVIPQPTPQPADAVPAHDGKVRRGREAVREAIIREREINMAEFEKREAIRDLYCELADSLDADWRMDVIGDANRLRPAIEGGEFVNIRGIVDQWMARVQPLPAVDVDVSEYRAALEARRVRRRHQHIEDWHYQMANWARAAQTMRPQRLADAHERKREQHAKHLTAVEAGEPIRLLPSDTQNGQIHFGLTLDAPGTFKLPVNSIPHMLVTGVSGSGKSTFMKSLLWQLRDSLAVERIEIIDLKGGLEFARFASPKVRVVWEYADTVNLVADIVVLMEARQAEMRSREIVNWDGPRTFLIVDEYAEIQNDIDAADTPEKKREARVFAGNLVRIARRARALGIVLICALQKPTTDAMDSGVRNNLNMRCCFRVATRLIAAGIVDDLETCPADPVRLKRGQFVLFDASAGVYRHLYAFS